MNAAYRIAMIFGLISLRLYPHLTYYFFAPRMGFWGLCFVMLALFNLIFVPMYYKTAYKYGGATVASIADRDVIRRRRAVAGHRRMPMCSISSTEPGPTIRACRP